MTRKSSLQLSEEFGLTIEDPGLATIDGDAQRQAAILLSLAATGSRDYWRAFR